MVSLGESILKMSLSDGPSEEDHLSTSPSLLRICQFLSPSDIFICLRLNSNFNRTISHNWSSLPRRAGDLVVNGQLSDGNMITEVGDSVTVRIMSVRNNWTGVDLTIGPAFLTVSGSDSIKDSVINFFVKHKVINNAEPLHFDPETRALSLNMGNHDVITVLRKVLMSMLPLVEVQHISLDEPPFKSIIYKRLSNCQILCIHECLNKMRRRKSKLYCNTLRVCGLTSFHMELVKSFEANAALVQLYLMESNVSDESILEIPNIRGALLLYVTNLSSMKGLQLLLQEWISGRRTISSVHISNIKRRGMRYRKADWLKFLSTFEEVDLKISQEGRLKGDFGRLIDDKRIRFEFLAEQYNFVQYIP